MKRKLDPIENGNKIFQNTLAKYPKEIKDIQIATKLLNEIIKETEGMVIVDFLDLGCWDRLKKLEIDPNGWLYLIQEEIKNTGKFQNGIAQEYRDGLILHFKDILTYSSDSLSGIFIRGHAITTNVIKKKLKERTTNFSISGYRQSNFLVEVERTINNIRESFDVFNAPIHSIAIIPKNSEIGSDASQELLFRINFHECLSRLQSRRQQLISTSPDDEDTICEKVNTGRRVFEFVLKIECCLLQHKVNFWGYEKPNETIFKLEYDKLKLGELKQIVSAFKSLSRRQDLNKIAEISNKLSHDSGVIIRKTEAVELLDLMISYALELYELVKDHDRISSHYTSNLKEKTSSSSTLTIKKISELNIK